MDWSILFLSADGRIGRGRFCIGLACVMLASLVIQVIPVAGKWLGFLVLWPQVCIHAERLHDMGRTAWLMLAPLGVSCAAVAITVIAGGAAIFASAPGAAPSLGPPLAPLGVAALVSLGFLLWVGLSCGAGEANRFGDPPAA